MTNQYPDFSANSPPMADNTPAFDNSNFSHENDDFTACAHDQRPHEHDHHQQPQPQPQPQTQQQQQQQPYANPIYANSLESSIAEDDAFVYNAFPEQQQQQPPHPQQPHHSRQFTVSIPVTSSSVPVVDRKRRLSDDASSTSPDEIRRSRSRSGPLTAASTPTYEVPSSASSTSSRMRHQRLYSTPSFTYSSDSLSGSPYSAYLPTPGSTVFPSHYQVGHSNMSVKSTPTIMAPTPRTPFYQHHNHSVPSPGSGANFRLFPSLTALGQPDYKTPSPLTSEWSPDAHPLSGHGYRRPSHPISAVPSPITQHPHTPPYPQHQSVNMNAQQLNHSQPPPLMHATTLPTPTFQQHHMYYPQPQQPLAHPGAPQTPFPPSHPPTANPANSFNPYLLYPSKVLLKLTRDLNTMTENWSIDEKESKRRLVQFTRTLSGNTTIIADFTAVSQQERSANGVCISCIYWEEKNDYFVTSVDTIFLLESLVGVRFTVEEKNRIRRNLEGFRPLTVSKSKSDSEDFFKVIMGFPNPKPRNIEKDVKVFPWKILGLAMKKIIGKYTASYSSTASTLSAPPAPVDSSNMPLPLPGSMNSASQHNPVPMPNGMISPCSGSPHYLNRRISSIAGSTSTSVSMEAGQSPVHDENEKMASASAAGTGVGLPQRFPS